MNLFVALDRLLRDSDPDIIARCTECGKTSVSIGWLHAHIEAAHTGFGPWNVLPDPRPARRDGRGEYTELLRIEDTTVVDREEVCE